MWMDRTSYAEQLLPKDPNLTQVLHVLDAHGLPQMSVRPMLGQLLTVLSKGCQRALEIGTYAGYSGICIARGLTPEGRLVTIEQRANHAELAARNFRDAGLAEVVEIRVGDALEQLESLMKESGEPFDLVFIDADKPRYGKYLETVLPLCRVGAWIVCDNVLARDRVLDPNDQNPTPAAMRRFNQGLFHHPRLTSALLPIYDGIALARVGPTSG
ncbi:caffeoyl-CoA O-methyltransferase [Alicyclobacillus hesperidum]|uniref:Caffeoyl-CoA O-methyltransferase n=1 Tax=Alicyclobacillus hesperidum TaxID=89784 RepID=A0A1H2VC39_9BACL|nr:O-methyltransferase [Alicyclobacillus hesperidum]SDW65872.1 caffeoyl-CoA O-methyltransferase [Alicyclobacillus hesperidum]